jgi:phosphate transport system permease protein
MSNMFSTPRDIAAENRESDKNLIQRTRAGIIWQVVFYIATAISILALITLLLNIIDSAFGYVAIVNTVEPETLVEQVRPGSDAELADLEKEELLTLLNENVRRGLVRALNAEQPLVDRSQEELVRLTVQRVVIPRVEKSWHLWESLTNREEIFRYAEEEMDRAWIQFRSWVSFEMLTKDLSNIPENAGLRIPILGSLMVIMITILFAFPVGVGAALYLEEFAPDNRLNRFIQVNIYNLSGVPSIIYGLLGLALFVRILEPFTSGFLFGAIEDHSSANGRTIVSGGLTLGLLILPIIIINAQEAIRAIPQSLRDSGLRPGSYPLADRMAPCVAGIHGPDPYRNHHRRQPGAGGNRAAGSGRGRPPS